MINSQPSGEAFQRFSLSVGIFVGIYLLML